jgi:hypothetical protein
MRSNRFLTVCVACVLSLGLVQGCQRGPSEEELKLAEFQGQFETLKQKYDALNQTRTEIADATTELAELEAVPERQLTDEQKARMDELNATLDELTATNEAAFEEAQSVLADFLNVGINDYPDSAETAAALKIYSDEAILVALDMVAKAGDYRKAVDHLSSAEGYFAAIGLEPPVELTNTIAELDDWRYITPERFDQITKGMTKDEVVATVGQVYFRNIQENPDKGVETWLYKKREGGAAAIYFRMKTGKVYDKRFDAVAATTVVAD